MRRFTFPHTLTLVSINHKHWKYEYAYSQSNAWTKNKCWHVLASIYEFGLPHTIKNVIIIIHCNTIMIMLSDCVLSGSEII